MSTITVTTKTIPEFLREIDLLFGDIDEITDSPEGNKVFGAIREKRMAIGAIFRGHPEVKSIFRFKRLMEFVKNGSHFGDYGKAIRRAEWIGRTRKVTTEELDTILNCFRTTPRTKIPFPTVGFRRVWYVAVDPSNASTQALIFALRDLYYRAKEEKEKGSAITIYP